LLERARDVGILLMPFEVDEEHYSQSPVRDGRDSSRVMSTPFSANE
jgi:hypothetical protein